MAQWENDSDDDFHSLCSHESYNRDGDVFSTIMEPPIHPVPNMQRPFEESIFESTMKSQLGIQDDASTAQIRRQRILDAESYDDSWVARWKQRPEAQHHPIVKHVAQIVFGMHLLQQEQAKSDEEVVKILQGHVNEVDTFLEQVAEDFGFATQDIKDRIGYMRLPMEHIEVFYDMLRDKKFRTNLASGNVKIEKIVGRTEAFLNASISDVNIGIESVKELAVYLGQVGDRYPADRKDIADIFDAMRRNERGWFKFLADLKSKGSILANELFALQTLVSEISKLVTAASRRSKPSSPKSPVSPKIRRTVSSKASRKSGSMSSDVRSRFARDSTPPKSEGSPSTKPLPKAPEEKKGRAKPLAIMTKPHPVPFERRYEQPRQGPPVPSGRKSPVSPISPESSPTWPRPRQPVETSSKDRRAKPERTVRLTTVKQSTPLGSHPPDNTVNIRNRGPKLIRSQSHGQNEVTNPVCKPPRHAISFSVNQITPPKSGRSQDQGIPNQSTQMFAVSQPQQPRPGSQPWTSGTAFARRISKRLRHEKIPAEDNPFTDLQPASRPVDSAHSSEAGERFDFNGVPYPKGGIRKRDFPSPPMCFDFDPNNTDFGAPLSALSPNVVAQINGFKSKQQPKTSPGTKFGRTMSIRKFFNRGGMATH